VIDELSDATSNQVVPDTSCASGHSYSDQSGGAGGQSHLSTFVTPTSRRQYGGRYPGRGGCSTSLTDVTDSTPDRGFVVTVSPVGTATLPPWCAGRRQQPSPQQVPAGVRYASTACVDPAARGHSPSAGRRNAPPPLHRKPPGVGYPGNGCHDSSACRLLGNDDSDWGADTTTTDDAAYSCADVSVALRDAATPASVRTQPADTTASTVVNPHQLCDEIDELFFKT